MGTDNNGDLLLPSGGYRRLKSFQLAQLIYDITVHFVKLYIPKESRTCDQMVQAARSGVQNIAEGSIDAATSAKLELNLYNVARASLEELKLDYQDYLRQHGEKLWNKDEFLHAEFVNRRISCKKEFREFIVWAEGRSSVPLRTVPYKSVLVANGTILLIETASYFLKRQIQRKAAEFLENGGFAERMHTMRTQKRKDQ
jgi:four helix bundle suffix protein